MTDDRPSGGVVRAKFEPGGREYHATCPDARIGDLIECSGWSKPARVVGYGRSQTHNSEPRLARVAKRSSKTERLSAAIQQAHADTSSQITYHTADIKMTGALIGALYTTSDEPEEYPAMPTKKTGSTNVQIANLDDEIAELQAQRKAAKKADKRARRIERERKAVLDAKVARHKLAHDTLEAIASDKHAAKTVRVEAANLLLTLT